MSPHYPTSSAAWYFSPPHYPGTSLTLKRRLNFYLVRLQRLFGHTKLVGYPMILTIEAANACNLRCPYCFVGAGETSREQVFFPPSLCERILDEMGDYLLEVELCNWGEPLLNRDVCDLIRLASTRGINTTLCTNFSVPFDSGRAVELVSSGLGVLGAAIDGTSQTTFEQYRVGGDLETALRNLELVRDARVRLSSPSPKLIWSFHVFEHNKGDIDQARSMAEDLGVELHVSKGWVEGEEWGRDTEFQFPLPLGADPCWFLWERATTHVDGGVSPCDGTFYREDDYGSMDGRSFREVWNNQRFQQARRLFHSRANCGDATECVCYECPATLTREDYVKHLAAGGSYLCFRPRFTSNDGFNHFFGRRPAAPSGRLPCGPGASPHAGSGYPTGGRLSRRW